MPELRRVDMTELEIRKKIEQYRVSDAPVHIKEAAIKELERKLTTSTEIAKQQYIEGLPDISDIGNQN